jgi:hypothetical protein
MGSDIMPISEHLIFNLVFISYIVAVSFIGGGSRRTRSNPSTCRKSVTDFIAILPLSTILLFDFRIVPTVWYFFSILLNDEKKV